jgi:hypothetical protein
VVSGLPQYKGDYLKIVAFKRDDQKSFKYGGGSLEVFGIPPYAYLTHFFRVNVPLIS